jgi:hypothetical protein
MTAHERRALRRRLVTAGADDNWAFMSRGMCGGDTKGNVADGSGHGA